MKTKYKYIHFDEGYTNNYFCRSKDGQCLGEVEYYQTWKEWVFSARNVHVVFSRDCLLDIADFLNQLTVDRKKVEVKK